MKIAYNRLRVILAEKKVSQVVLADLLGVRPETVSRWVNNEVQPYVHELYEIAKLLKINLQLLFVETKWDDGPSAAELAQAAKKNSRKGNSDSTKRKTK